MGDGSGTPDVTDHSFSAGGVALEHCLITETSYIHPDPALQSSGRNILDQRDAVVLLPKNLLTLGVTYTVALTVDGQPRTWSFQVAPGFIDGLNGAVAPAGAGER